MIVLIFGYFSFLGFFFIKIKYFTFNEVDLNKDGILTLSEISYFLSTGKRYKYWDGKEYKYIEYHNIFNKDVTLEIFSLKDGLILKEIKIT